MFAPALLEVCCVAVMAPALTQAVRQADGPNLLLSHRQNLTFLPCKIEHSYPSDRSVVLACPAKLARATAGGPHPSDDNRTSVQNGQLRHAFKACNGNKSPIRNHVQSLDNNTSELIKEATATEQLTSADSNLKPVGTVNGHCGRPVGSPGPTGQCWEDLDDNKMNVDIDQTPATTEKMGLLNTTTNTPVDCDFKSKVSNSNHPCALSSPGESPTRSEPMMTTSTTTKDSFAKCSIEPHLSPPGSPKSASGESTSTVTAQNLPVVTFSELEEVRNSHQKNFSRARNLMQRLRQLQATQLDRHSTVQLESVISHYQSSHSIPCQRQLRRTVQRRNKDPVDLKTEFLHNEDVRNLSTAALVNLVRKIESSGSTPGQVMLQSTKNALSYMEDSFSNSRVSVKLKPSDCDQLRHVAGSLLTKLKHTEAATDPDVTDSSSGGESCDELDGYDEKRSYTVPIQKRAMWRWVQDRSSIAKRWVWIQTQVSDIEYKVRQISDLLAQARVAKGIVSLEQPNVTEPSTSLAVPSSNNLEQAVKKTLRSVNGYLDPSSVMADNGYHPVQNFSQHSEPAISLEDSVQEKSSVVPASKEGETSSRTQPLKLDVFRRRKLLRTAGLHMISRKAARLSTVKCNCNSRADALPCILCGGRYNNMQSVYPNLMPLQERIALLQPTFHPVLSLEQDVHFSLHFENVLKRNESYYHVPKPGHSPVKKPHLSEQSRSFSDHRVKNHSRKLSRHAAHALLTSARYRSRKHSRSSILHSKGVLKNWKKGAFMSRKRMKNWSTASSCSSRPESPEHNPGLLEDSVLNSLSGHDSSLQKRRDDHQFDIDNIVIPYNIKTTNFEKPQYKEIITPKWRYVEEEVLVSGEDSDDVEDISEETIQKRYEKLEIEEKKHLRCGSNLAGNRRGRRNFRYDSRAGSSGANTPDHISFSNPDILFQDSSSLISGGHMSPVMSPPPTPYSLAAMSDDSQPSCSTTPAPCNERRRTISFTKKDKVLENSEGLLMLPLQEEVVHYPPFDRRTFPLSDEEHQQILDEASKIKESEQVEPERDVEEDFTTLPEVSSPESPESSSSSTSSAIEEDENDMADPEWTVVRKQNGSERTLVIKLAKR